MEIKRSKARSTGTVVILNDRGRSDEWGDWRWETVCEEHGGVCSHETRKLATEWMAHPEEWCEDLRRGNPRREGGGLTVLKNHYHLFVIAVGKSDIERVYLPMEEEFESREAATERFVSERTSQWKRNIAKKRTQVSNSIIEYRVCRPSSWRIARREEAAVDGSKSKTSRRRKP